MNGGKPKIVTLEAVTSKIQSLGARSPSPAVVDMCLNRQKPVIGVTITDDQARQAARAYADDEKMLPELAMAATVTPVYLPKVLQDKLPEWAQAGANWKPGQKWNVLPDPNLASVVLIGCGGAKVSVDEAHAWPAL